MLPLLDKLGLQNQCVSQLQHVISPSHKAFMLVRMCCFALTGLLNYIFQAVMYIRQQT